MPSHQREPKRRTEFTCRVCKQPVEATLTRRKTLGIFVPVWEPGPCKNPDCRRHRAADTEKPQDRAHS
ncbi:hypothetical protein F0344_18580 [Streptomyces finlayi]|uniref:Uncharacterized protein n=1 Tax=Streptomyces finlayi TaxID=67296 RepID=A0A7G7BLZ9_9ACTN|nr:hypothetical protein [Streptomyces finlayi]QNE76364.1 hypothetical protein F0344_18580 [Streptomyces finlayi]